ncbi:hypothetical protein [Curtobacterium sp. MCBA15_001]|uniref:hypothetical protein n=1 Tax=Curtobacterium sp. MCBA15_001 TaxID=1898731 RepID=UPI001587A924|nr:hypothetical protein [Curtobacterium sp. MCBA15_001]
MIFLGPGSVRCGSAAIGLVVAIVGCACATGLWDDVATRWVACLVLFLGLGGGGWLTGRALRLGVVVGDPDHFLVRGLLWSRRIRYSAIFSMPRLDTVTTIPFIGWHDRGRRRYTPLTAFWVPEGPLAKPSRRWAMNSLQRLERHRVNCMRSAH